MIALSASMASRKHLAAWTTGAGMRASSAGSAHMLASVMLVFSNSGREKPAHSATWPMAWVVLGKNGMISFTPLAVGRGA